MAASHRIWLLAVAVLAAGCATMSGKASAPDLRGFPIGIYNVADPKHLDLLKADGFDAFLPAPKDASGYEALARRARKLGMSMVLQPQPFWDKPSKATAAWPILAWYLMDEPEVNKMTPDVLAGVAKRVKEWDPGRAQTFVVGGGRWAQPYAETADVLMLDWYPVPHRPLTSVAEEFLKAQRSLPKDKPVWMVLQAFDWSEDSAMDHRALATRFPTYEEIRFMSYSSIMAGAKGLFYFRLPVPPSETLFDYPERWQAVARVTRELKLFKPVLEGGRPSPLPFPPNPDGPDAKAWNLQGRTFVVLANPRKASFLKVPDEVMGAEWRPLFTLRREQKSLLKAIGKGFYLKPYQVLALEGPGQAETRTW
ncbi:MAG: hypothetical protein HY924_15530 [Elusimicrobia bacterium]|nr:hypothetical protein [Elusimicrobiota bacterium]